MNKPKVQQELQTFGSNFATKRRSLFHSKSFNPGGLDQMFVSVNKPQVPNREEWSHLMNASEQKIGILPPKRSTSSVVGDYKHVPTVSKTKEDDETNSTLKLRLEAMTWAAMAKDATILALHQRLKSALLSLQTERDANSQLRTQLEMSAQELRNTQIDEEAQSMGNPSVQDGEQPMIVDPQI